MALPGKRIAWQADSTWPGLAIQVIPVEAQALDPHLRQLVHLALGNPRLQRVGHVFIGSKHRQRFLAAIGLAAVHIVDLGLALGVRGQLVLETLQVDDDQRDPMGVGFAANLQRVGHVAQLAFLHPADLDRLEQLSGLLLQPRFVFA